MKTPLPVAFIAALIALSACAPARRGASPPAVEPPPAAAAPAAPEIGSGTTTPNTTLGTLAGGYLGSQFGQNLDDNARDAAAAAEREALGNNSAANWRSDNGDATGRVQPLRSFTDAAGRQCREYRETITAHGRSKSGAGIACRASDGSWALVGS
jgi:surface antigen